MCGSWWIDFKGDELKVAERGGKINTFHVAFPPELVDHLEEFLARFRPILSDGDTDPHVFGPIPTFVSRRAN
jgi:hypothetical protein